MDLTSKQYFKFWMDECNSSYLYQVLSECEKDEKLAEVYRRIAVVEANHAKKWEERLKNEGVEIPVFQPSNRTKVLAWLARRFGVDVILNSIQKMEQKGTEGYLGDQSSKEMAGEERSHARLVQQISRSAIRGGIEGGALAQLEGRHRSGGGNALRAAVLGANDGLVSNLSLVMGVAGAALESRSILITGMAGLLAGACSMALGEWLSVQSSRELYANQIKIETQEIAQDPTEEKEELSLIYQSRGLTETQANMLAQQILDNNEFAIDTLAREELGIDPKELGGSAWEAAITSFILFSIGAIVPVAPFFFAEGLLAVVISIGLSGLALFGIGAAITLFTGRSVWYSGFRMVIFGLIAAAITYAIGSLIGVSLAG